MNKQNTTTNEIQSLIKHIQNLFESNLNNTSKIEGDLLHGSDKDKTCDCLITAAQNLCDNICKSEYLRDAEYYPFETGDCNYVETGSLSWSEGPMITDVFEITADGIVFEVYECGSYGWQSDGTVYFTYDQLLDPELNWLKEMAENNIARHKKEEYDRKLALYNSLKEELGL